MDFSVHSLGSGSAGNSVFIQAGGTRILIDAGVNVLQLQKRLSKYRISLSDIDAVFLTHEHGDHSRSIYSLSRRYGVPIIANPATLTVLSREFAAPNWRVLDTGCSRVVGDVVVESFPISHDAVDPVGYSVYYRSWKVSLVTDTGVAGAEISAGLAGSNLAIIEANHDVERLIAGPYPESLKGRILSDTGHLSNDAASDLILRLSDTVKSPTFVWLAHLSDTNNTPRLARRSIQKRLSDADCGNIILDVAPRDSAGLIWRPGSHAVQMPLFSLEATPGKA